MLAGSLLKQEHKVLGDAVYVEPAAWPVSSLLLCLIMFHLDCKALIMPHIISIVMLLYT